MDIKVHAIYRISLLKKATSSPMGTFALPLSYLGVTGVFGTSVSFSCFLITNGSINLPFCSLMPNPIGSIERERRRGRSGAIGVGESTGEEEADKSKLNPLGGPYEDWARMRAIPGDVLGGEVIEPDRRIVSFGNDGGLAMRASLFPTVSSRECPIARASASPSSEVISLSPSSAGVS